MWVIPQINEVEKDINKISGKRKRQPQSLFYIFYNMAYEKDVAEVFEQLSNIKERRIVQYWCGGESNIPFYDAFDRFLRKESARAILLGGKTGRYTSIINHVDEHMFESIMSRLLPVYTEPYDRFQTPYAKYEVPIHPGLLHIVEDVLLKK